jgi:hypothetical protein
MDLNSDINVYEQFPDVRKLQKRVNNAETADGIAKRKEM